MNKLVIFLICFGFAFEFDDFDSTKIKDPKVALFLSIVPGCGQIYNGKYVKSIFFLSSEYVLINNIRINKNSNDINSNSFIKNRNSNMWWLLGIYVLNLIDAYVDAHLSSFPNKKIKNKSENIE